MPKLHVVWDVEKAKAITEPLIYGAAAESADACEQAYKSPFLVIPAQDVALSL